MTRTAFLVFTLLATLGLPATIVKGACRQTALPSTEVAFSSALLRRLRPLGISAISLSDSGDSGRQFKVIGAQFSLFLRSKDGLLSEVGMVLDDHPSAAQLEQMLTAAAFTVGAFSDTSEAAARDRLNAAFDGPIGSRVERFGTIAAGATKMETGLVLKIGRVDCAQD